MRDKRDKHSSVADALRILDICNDGKYTTLKNGKPIEISLGEIKSAVYKSSEDLSSLDFELKALKQDKPTIIITENSTVDDVIIAGRQTDAYSIGVLNFASSLNPGGGFLTGAMAQEEALCHASTLYTQLKQCTELYDTNKKLNNKYYTDNMAVSKTRFFANSSGVLLPNPIDTIVVTSAAVNLNKLRDTSGVEDVMRQRMHKIIQLFISEGCKILILGAFGCGVFRNNPVMISNIWKDELAKYGGYFDKVYFSIYSTKDNPNIRAFRNTFK